MGNTTSPTALGYIGVSVAVLFFGSNFVVTKKYPTGDGLAFSFLMSSGILCVGWISLAIPQTIIFVPAGLLSGFLWSVGNLMTVPIIKLCGLGVGLLLW